MSKAYHLTAPLIVKKDIVNKIWLIPFNICEGKLTGKLKPGNGLTNTNNGQYYHN